MFLVVLSHHSGPPAALNKAGVAQRARNDGDHGRGSDARRKLPRHGRRQRIRSRGVVWCQRRASRRLLAALERSNTMPRTSTKTSAVAALVALSAMFTLGMPTPAKAWWAGGGGPGGYGPRGGPRVGYGCGGCGGYGWGAAGWPGYPWPPGYGWRGYGWVPPPYAPWPPDAPWQRPTCCAVPVTPAVVLPPPPHPRRSTSPTRPAVVHVAHTTHTQSRAPEPRISRPTYDPAPRMPSGSYYPPDE